MDESKAPRVTVVIPSFNHAHFVGNAIQSVLNQTFRDFEIIVVDDGSTDETQDVIAQFASQVSCIRQENQGLSAARNLGIREASGEFLGFLDADDGYHPDFLVTLVALLDRRTDIGAAYCGYRFVDALDKPLPRSENRTVRDVDFHRAMLEGNFLVPESVLLRRRCLEEIGFFDESLTACEDWDVWLRISEKHLVIGTDEVLTRHRVLPGSMSSDPERMLANRMDVLTKYFSTGFGDGAYWSMERRRAYGRAYLISCGEFLQAQDVEGGFRCFSNMAKLCPELLADLETHYELALVDQAKGYRGDFSTIHVPSSGLFLLQMLERLFHESEVSAFPKSARRVAIARAYQALGLLSYGARQFNEARFFLMRGLRADPKTGIHPRFSAPLIKSLIGVRAVEWLNLRKRQLRAISGL